MNYNEKKLKEWKEWNKKKENRQDYYAMIEIEDKAYKKAVETSFISLLFIVILLSIATLTLK